MNASTKLETPRFETGRPLLIAGLGARYTFDTAKDIPDLWGRFGPFFGTIPGQVGMTAYGVISDTRKGADGFTYTAGAEVSGLAGLPAEFSHLHIPGQRYAVFPHHGHVSALGPVSMTIWNEWLPKSGHTVADGPVTYFERYDEEFDPAVATGHVEIWIPIKA